MVRRENARTTTNEQNEPIDKESSDKQTNKQTMRKKRETGCRCISVRNDNTQTAAGRENDKYYATLLLCPPCSLCPALSPRPSLNSVMFTSWFLCNHGRIAPVLSLFFFALSHSFASHLPYFAVACFGTLDANKTRDALCIQTRDGSHLFFVFFLFFPVVYLLFVKKRKQRGTFFREG